MSVDVDGQATSVTATVTPAAYTLTPNTINMTQHAAHNETFTVEVGGTPMPGVSVTFAANANFTGLLTTPQTTNASGQIVLSGFVATVAGTQTLTLDVDGQAMSVIANVTAATYTLTPATINMSQHIAQTETFTVMVSGTPIANVPVTFAANPNFTNLPPTAQTTDASGQVIVNNLIATAAGAHTLAITVDGHAMGVAVNVTAATYTLTPTTISMSQHTAQTETFTVMVSGTPVQNVPVTFTANPNFTNLVTTAQPTDASGNVTMNNLIATVAGTQILTVDVDGQPFSVTANVTAATYSLVPINMTQLAAYTGTVTVMAGTTPVPGLTVTYPSTSTISRVCRQAR